MIRKGGRGRWGGGGGGGEEVGREGEGEVEGDRVSCYHDLCVCLCDLFNNTLCISFQTQADILG